METKLIRMRPSVFLFFFLFVAGVTGLAAQDTLLSEDFNSCAFNPGWQVSSAGNPSIIWYVDLSQNPDAPGQSIDSTCFLFIDDNATGVNTPAYTITFTSPAFDVTPYQTVECTMDVYFRFGEDDYLEVLVTDGVKESLLARFDQYRTNDKDFSKHFSLRHDLSLVSKSANTRLIFRYTSPAGSNGHYAGIDNVKVVGSGSGTNVLTEAFDDCVQPAGWTSEIISGQGGWKFGRVPQGSSAFFNGNSMDGSCMVFFDDAAEGDGAPPSAMRLTSPWFAGDQFFNYQLDLDAILRYNGETLAISLENNSGDKILLYQSDSHVGGPFFPDYVHLAFDLTPYRAQQLRIVFDYNDGKIWGYWVGLDNIKVTGIGPAYDFCNQARPLLTGDACQAANNQMALFDGPPAACSGRTTGSLWFRWDADFTGIAKLVTHADFNDVVSIFTGGCTAPQLVLCDNHDEHGFTGESTYFPAQAGAQYLIRITGLDQGFGLPRGNLCAEINPVAAYPTRPANDDCANAVSLAINGPCVAGDNLNALTSAKLPSMNTLARGDVWYKFTTVALPPNERYVVQSNATFSDIITVYGGGCAAMQEIKANPKGGQLELPALAGGQTYYVQIAGNFATVEGQLCAAILTKPLTTPPNDDCLAAISIPIGGECVSGNNRGAAYSGYRPPCVVSADRDIWFKFVAPAFGSVHINSGANFEHTVAIWSGNCNDLKPVFCAENPLRCSGFITAGNLNAGQTYYLQIASWNGPSGAEDGDVCVRILDGAVDPGFKPLTVSVREICVGMDTARLLVTTGGGTPPYSYPANTPGQILLSGAPYTVLVVDSTGCETYFADTIAACASTVCTQEVSLTLTAPTCPGDTDGVILSGVQGGTGPYTFTWSNQVFTAQNSGLGAGTYTLTIVDANACETVVTQTLVDPDPILILPDSIIQPVQGQSNGAIDVQITGGKSPLTYVWVKDNAPYATGVEDLSGLAGGTYSLLVTDSSGCTGSASFVLTETVGTHSADAVFYAAVIPNPAKDKAVLIVELRQMQTLQLSITDALGRVLHRWMEDAGPGSQIGIDLKDLPGGMYFLHLLAGHRHATLRLVVSR